MELPARSITFYIIAACGGNSLESAKIMRVSILSRVDILAFAERLECDVGRNMARKE